MRHLYLLLLLGANLAFAQLQPFTINVTPTPETCNRNGALSWTVNNRTDGTTITYSIYRLPDENTALTPTEQMKISGLVAGQYKVVATQSDGSNTNFASQTVNVEDKTIPLLFEAEVKNEFCGNDGALTINVGSGTPPYSYQLLDDNNTPILSQNSNTFTGLTKGTYKVRVNDACGKGVVKEITIQKEENSLDNFDAIYKYNACKRYISISKHFNSNIKGRNFKIKISYRNPTTNELIEQEITKSTQYANYFNAEIDLKENFSGETITYTYTITDECGNEKTDSFEALNIGYDASIESYKIRRDNCGNSLGFSLKLTSSTPHNNLNITGVNYTHLPEGVTQEDMSNYYTGDNHYHFSKNGDPLKEGLYEGELIICDGKASIPFSYEYTPNQEAPPINLTINFRNQEQLAFCGNTIAHGYFEGNRAESIEILDVPNGGHYTNNQSQLTLYNFPSGVYHAKIIDKCTGASHTFEFTVSEYQTYPPGEVEVQRLCGGFNIIGKNNASYGRQERYLQIYDEALGGWTTPKTDIQRKLFDPNNEKSYDFSSGTSQLNHTALKIKHNKETTNLIEQSNIEFAGKFRVIQISRIDVYDENNSWKERTKMCFDVIKEFEFSEQPIINQINSFKCTDGTYNVGMQPKGGVGPYTYQIVKDINSIADENILIDNGNQPVFGGLTPGIYLFRVLDNCGNYITSEYEITTLGAPKIRTVANCDTQTVQFILDGVDYLNFEWYKEGEPGTILSTSNTLDLGTFTSDKAGTYRLHVTSNLSGVCIDEILSVRISENPFTNPHAGLNNNATICPTRSIYLGEYLRERNPGEGVDSYGKWERVNTADYAGALVGDEWFANLAKPGVYEFRYVVKGLCSGEDVATITINTRDVEAPTSVSCPSDIVVNATSTNDIATATWTTPTFDGCRLKVSSNKEPGDTFSAGNTEVIYTAEDQNGNTATCKFNVTVNRFTCAKKPNTGAPQSNVKVGISNLNRTTQTTEWVNSYKDGWIAMESKTKGFVITRADDVNHPETAIENPVEGMIVFDIDENCIKLYDGTKWACVAQGCNDDNASNP